MIDPDGTPNVIEYNCRFGDPETQPIMMRLKSDLRGAVRGRARQAARSVKAEWDPRAALGVVMAADGYPDTVRKGDVIAGLDAAARCRARCSMPARAPRTAAKWSRTAAACCAPSGLGTSVSRRRRRPTRWWTQSTGPACNAGAISVFAPWRERDPATEVANGGRNGNEPSHRTGMAVRRARTRLGAQLAGRAAAGRFRAPLRIAAHAQAARHLFRLRRLDDFSRRLRAAGARGARSRRHRHRRDRGHVEVVASGHDGLARRTEISERVGSAGLDEVLARDNRHRRAHPRAGWNAYVGSAVPCQHTPRAPAAARGGHGPAAGRGRSRRDVDRDTVGTGAGNASRRSRVHQRRARSRECIRRAIARRRTARARRSFQISRRAGRRRPRSTPHLQEPASTEVVGAVAAVRRCAARHAAPVFRHRAGEGSRSARRFDAGGP